MKGVILTAFVCLTINVTFAQQTWIRWQDNQHLQWEDFRGKVNDSSRYDAESFAEICYSYTFYNETDFEFNVYANFDKNTSWRRKETQCESLLKHEQTHFNIAELYAEKLKSEFESCNYTAAYHVQIESIFSKNKLEYHAMQKQYDEETNHSLNKKKQKEWEDFVSRELVKVRLHLQLAQEFKKDKKDGI